MFLACTPSVFVVENQYAILINTLSNGICSVTVNGKKYYEDNAGTLSSQKNHFKIFVPQSELNLAKSYSIGFKKTIVRQSYFSKFEQEKFQTFEFCPPKSKKEFNMYFVSDVHYKYDLALKTANFFGDNVDLFLIGGDFCEFNSLSDYFDIAKFLGDLTAGKIPLLFARGNHDVRGEFCEFFTDYFPADYKNTYYVANFDFMRFLVLDCGEDKNDDHEEYGESNDFHSFRAKQTKFLQSIEKSDLPTFAISHICPSKTAQTQGSVFDIERENYAKWNEEFKRLNLKFMICGHFHETFLLSLNDEKSIIKNDYPVIVGSQPTGEDFIGTALTLANDKLIARFTNANKQIIKRHVLDLLTKTWVE